MNRLLKYRAIVWQLFKFGVIGVVATGVHVVIATIAIKKFTANQIIANCLAFIIASFVSYIGHAKITFNSPMNRASLAKFLVVNGVGFLTALIVSSIAEYYRLPYQLGIALVVTTVPIASYLLHRLWTFREN
jgi:putative flippase GtrA